MPTKEELKVAFSTGKKPTGADFADLIDGVVGPKGATGTAGTNGAVGAAGTTGATGTAGKDGFGTKAQYDDIIARLVVQEAKP